MVLLKKDKVFLFLQQAIFLGIWILPYLEDYKKEYFLKLNLDIS
jgi:hypothetical protein